MKNIPHKQLQIRGTGLIGMTMPYLSFILLLISQKQPVCSQNISFKKVIAPNESPFALVTGITQDAQGNMWFTSGPVLYSYNAYEFITYKNSPTDSLGNLINLVPTELDIIKAHGAKIKK
jgi:hypothetical protein